MFREVIVWPNNELHKSSEPVTEFDEKLIQFIIDLHQTMKRLDSKPHAPDVAGLAAPQVGVHKRIFVYKMNGESTCMINPVILEKEGEQCEPEGCLSFPGVYIRVPRAEKILVEFQDVDGKKNQLRTDGFTARVIQHEIDHLDGITYLFGISQVKRDLITRKLRKVKKRFEKQKREFDEFKRQQQQSSEQFPEAQSGRDNRPVEQAETPEPAEGPETTD